MCGIVGAVAQREVEGILVEGLKRLEYRGYDSAGVALIDSNRQIQSVKRAGKVSVLEEGLSGAGLKGHVGIAHTRWATHGKPSEINAHPHLSGDQVALAHNGIIENHEALRKELTAMGYEFVSETDTEVIVHLIHSLLSTGGSLLEAVKVAIKRLEGAFGLVVVNSEEPDKIVAARSGSPLVIGLGIGENFLASDQLALRQVTDRFIYLEEGDIAELSADDFQIWDSSDKPVQREKIKIHESAEVAEKGAYRHFMMKEIFEQSKVITDTLDGRIGKDHILEEAFGVLAGDILDSVEVVQIVACGTSYHAGMVARYWIEGVANVACRVEVASEFRYRKFKVAPNTLLLTISQSGETADTLAALRMAKTLGYSSTMTICNVAQSSLVRESDLVLMTRAGPEIGVASTKAFTTQLVALLLLTIALGRRNGIGDAMEKSLVQSLHELPSLIDKTLELDKEIEQVSELFADKHHALFLGRGTLYPIAMEGALKIKEISYIHAESYAAGELKHGPLALIDDDMPVVAVAPNDDLLEKLKSNLEEVRARGGQLFVFADKNAGFEAGDNVTVINVPHTEDIVAPIVYTIPLQLLSYHVAVLKGTDVDQPRNLAKSVTVE